MINGKTVIAEVKTQSPFLFSSPKSWNELFDIANNFGDIISIHTDSCWGGSFNLLKKARKLTKKPILAKGLHKNNSEIEKSIELGADLVLVVGRLPHIHKEKCLIEPLNLKELKRIPEDFKVVWNSRDLSNGKMKKETFKDARKIWKG
ncbi:hypothetical protein J4225_02965 [Candidatus Pacearchaeota archaeon]|nr:hypothetical protein [uncultured archaeon]MBS3085621.1 hypothetical protein [Candidatus Pacearchaeota archaeon]